MKEGREGDGLRALDGMGGRKRKLGWLEGRESGKERKIFLLEGVLSRVSRVSRVTNTFTSSSKGRYILKL